MKHPSELVEKYGAKAGILMYIARELPDIPQARMMVKIPGESIDDALRRAEEESIRWPRIFRSSAAAELDGYEGDFPTVVIGDFETERAKITNPGYVGTYSRRDIFDAYVRETIEDIETSPKWLKEKPGNEHLPDKISVIIAEKSPSKVVGTYVKHPNQDDTYLISCSLASDADSVDASRSNYIFRLGERVKPLDGFTAREVEKSKNVSEEKIRQELEKAILWHDRIGRLPEMDSEWAYQVEFGLDPLCLYQVRPFKRREIADFQVEPTEFYEDTIVIGITPKDGIRVRVDGNLWDRHCKGNPINPDKQPSVFYGSMREARHIELLPNLQANLLPESHGFLAHEDIKAMRLAQVTGLFSGGTPEKYEIGEWVTIVADGKSIRVERVA